MRVRPIAVWTAAALAMLAAVAVAASVLVSRPLFDDALDPSVLDRVIIAPTDEALTFARIRGDGGAPRVLLVKTYEEGYVTGVDITARLARPGADPVALFREFGYDALVRAGQTSSLVRVPAAALDIPLDAPERNVGVGLNYAEHAAESGLEEPPFLFPKYAEPTRHDSPIAREDAWLLDYEAELGLVLLDPLVDAGAPAPRFGLVIANEVTDRWALVRNLDRDEPMGTTGFADGKSRNGFAPIGPLFVIPLHPEVFYRRIDLRLWVNGRLRQKESSATMRWEPRRIMNEMFRSADQPYVYRGQNVSLFGAGPPLPPGTIIFSGTPAGVIFKPLNLWNPWVYLQPGDEVVVRAEFLGTIRNRITD